MRAPLDGEMSRKESREEMTARLSDSAEGAAGMACSVSYIGGCGGGEGRL